MYLSPLKLTYGDFCLRFQPKTSNGIQGGWGWKDNLKKKRKEKTGRHL